MAGRTRSWTPTIGTKEALWHLRSVSLEGGHGSEHNGGCGGVDMSVEKSQLSRRARDGPFTENTRVSAGGKTTGGTKGFY